MMRIRRILLVSLAVSITFAATVRARQDKTDTRMPLRDKSHSASITGRVMLPSGQGSGGNLKVVLTTIEAPLMTLYTNKDGEFVFRNLQAGTYFVKVYADEKLFEPLSEQVWLNPGAPVYVTLYLKEKKGPAVKESRGNVVNVAEIDSDIPDPAKKEYERARKLIDDGDIDSAITHLKQAIAIYPDYLMARNDLGVQYLKRKRLAEAEDQFRTVVEKNPKYFNSRLNLGVVLVEQKRFDEAIAELSQAVSIDSSHPAAHLFWGIASLELNDLPVAERELVKALLLGGERYSSAHYYFAHVYLKTGRREEAARELRLFLKTAAPGEMAAQARALLEQLNSAK
ncbi:MAG TPA: tetratricopeptide repeat protein [Blastocatellia bacterium]|nr:tetratricopeptide repeat protein [Blastocatellia bacterium]